MKDWIQWQLRMEISEIYFSIFHVYLTSMTREAERESLSKVSNPYLLPGPWVFPQM